MTLARTSHRPVRYTDASGILRNAGYKKSVDKEKRKYFVFHLERIALFKAKQGCWTPFEHLDCDEAPKAPFFQYFRIMKMVRFRSAALMKSGRNVEFTAFLFFLAILYIILSVVKNYKLRYTVHQYIGRKQRNNEREGMF